MQIETPQTPQVETLPAVTDTILVVDDDVRFCELMEEILDSLGFQVISSNTLNDGMVEAKSASVGIVLLDVHLPDGDGLNAVSQFVNLASQPEVIIITAESDQKGAELALQNGAWDYIVKPPDFFEFKLTIQQALKYRKERTKPVSPKVLKREKIIGNSPKLEKCLMQVAQAASSVSNVLITGETGTGKEVFAQTIHENSDRAMQNLVVVDCSALPENLVESMLFGHVKGAFTGAVHHQEGLIRQADGGTLFLDEVGELSLETQAKLLRVLQERTFRSLGSAKEQRSEFRLLAATNKDLAAMVKQGRFREDLYYRLLAIEIVLPPLRERIEDINQLVVHFVMRICRQLQSAIKGISPQFLTALQYYPWPGNIRELINTLETSISQHPDESTLYIKHLPLNIRVNATNVKSDDEEWQTAATEEDLFLREDFPVFQEFRSRVIDKEESFYLNRLVKRSEGQIADACRLSGLSRARVYQLLKKHNLSLTSF